MISNKHYVKIMESIISCINCGDYYSIKELSTLELEKMKKYKKLFNKGKRKKLRYKYSDTLF